LVDCVKQFFPYLFSDKFEIGRFTKNLNGNPQLVDMAGFVYSKHRANSIYIQWRCQKNYEGRKCTARATTEGNYIIFRSNEHRHPPLY